MFKINILLIFLLFDIVIIEVYGDPCNDAVIINDDSRSTAFVPGQFDVLLCDSGDQIVSGMYNICYDNMDNI